MASWLASLGLELLGPEIADDIALIRSVGTGRRRRRRRRRTKRKKKRHLTTFSRVRHRPRVRRQSSVRRYRRTK